MDEQTVRKHLDVVKVQLARNEQEHSVLMQLLHGYEGWLQLGGINDYNGAPVQQPLVPRDDNPHSENTYVVRSPQPNGKISFRGAVSQILDEARGAPLHTKEIGVRALALGVITKAKDIPAIIDLMCIGIDGAEKVGPRTWRKMPKQPDAPAANKKEPAVL